MHILIVSQYFWPENFRVNDLSCELQAKGHTITVLTGLPNYPKGEIFSEFIENRSEYNTYKNVEIIRVPILPRGKSRISLAANYLSFLLSASIFGPVKLWRRKIDVVLICQLSPATVAIPGLILSKIKRAKNCMWILDLWPDSLVAIGVLKNKKIEYLLQKIMNLIYRRCNLIFVQSNGFKNKISSLTGPKTKVVYAPTWAESDFNSAKNQSPHDWHTNKPFIVTFAGNIGAAQDMDCIINAAKILKSNKQIKFHLIGDGSDAERTASLIEQNLLQDCVFMFGRHPLEKMPEFYNQSDIFLITLTDEPIFSMTVPGKLQSYLAFGKPIVGALNGEPRDVILESKAGYCAPSGDHKELARLILKMYNLNSEEREILGDNGKKFYDKVFERVSIIDKFEKNIVKLITR